MSDGDVAHLLPYISPNDELAIIHPSDTTRAAMADIINKSLVEMQHTGNNLPCQDCLDLHGTDTSLQTIACAGDREDLMVLLV